MTQLASHPIRRARPSTGLVITSVAALCLPATAHAQAQWAVQTSASAGVESNPYFSSGSGVALTGTLDIQPSIVLDLPLTRLQLSGDAQAVFYDRGLDPRETISLNGSGTHRLSERTTFSAQIGFVDDIIGSVYAGAVPFVDPVLAAAPVAGQGTTDAAGVTTTPVITLPATLPVYLNDPTLGELGRRRQTYQASGNISTLISTRDSLSAGTAVSLNRYGQLQNYNYAAPSVSWQHALGPRTSIGAGFQAGFINYLHTERGDATTYGPQLLGTFDLGNRLIASATIGITFANLRDQIGGDRTTRSVSGSFNLCRQADRSSLCVNGARQVSPSAFQGVTTVSIVTASYSYRLSPKSSIQASGSYSHSDSPLEPGLSGLGGSSVDYGSASGSYSRRLGPKLSGFVSAGYAQPFGGQDRRGADINGQIGVSYRFTPRP